jgi:outer membrane protein assembly factor BamB
MGERRKRRTELGHTLRNNARPFGETKLNAGSIPALGLAIVALLGCSILCTAQETTMLRGDAARSGVSGSAAPKSVGHVLWEFKTGGRVLSSPVVADGAVYVGSDDHFVYAIDAAKGSALWKFKTAADVNSTPAVAHGAVYVLSLDGNAYALDARSGKQIWKFKTEGESRLDAAGLYGMAPSREVVPDVWDFFLSSPAVDGETVYFGSGDRHVYALDARTGALRWKFETGDVVHSSPAIANGTLYVGCWDGLLYALNAETGRLLWKFATGVDATHFMQGIPGSPSVASGTVVFGSRDGNIYALDANTGKLIWKQGNEGSWVVASPAILGNTVYITTSDSMKLRALDLKTGTESFSLTYKTYSFSSPIVAGGHAYFGTFDGALYDADLNARKFAGEFRVQASLRHKELLTADGHLNQAAVFGPLGPDGNPDNTIDAAFVGIQPGGRQRRGVRRQRGWLGLCAGLSPHGASVPSRKFVVEVGS